MKYSTKHIIYLILDIILITTFGVLTNVRSLLLNSLNTIRDINKTRTKTKANIKTSNTLYMCVFWVQFRFKNELFKNNLLNRRSSKMTPLGESEGVK